MARLQPVALVLYLALVLALGIARLEPHLTVRFSPVASEQEPPVVAVTGAVRRPGVYALEPGARVADALAAAGGATPEADLDALDLALPIADGESLRVPARGEAAAAAPGVPRPRVSVNRASAEELESVPGIGPALARRIVAWRPFRTLDELVRVPGIGPRTLERLRPYLTP
ncbi:ComEA family DNA-binding protein [Oceanithermus desulfurans]|uniref:Helix-hairpin-helix domain-containing protein n=1 Tax=Oceanithermus profundus TaxID=187137 RepID=A0A7C5SS23_9DEIN|nr:helix-hairpin-helix domain-containing protein [Oceanithermus profundus]